MLLLIVGVAILLILVILLVVVAVDVVVIIDVFICVTDVTIVIFGVVGVINDTFFSEVLDKMNVSTKNYNLFF
jgi:hypothetical protein